MSGAVRAVTLDAAGTLIRVNRPVAETYVAIAARHGIVVDGGLVARSFRRVFASMPPLAFSPADSARLPQLERAWWRTLVRDCLGAAGRQPTFDAFFDELFEHYRSGDAWSLFPEVPNVLDQLERAGVPAAVVSNFDGRLHDILCALGVHGRFRSVLCSTETGAAKPDARIFHAGCRALGAPPHAVLHAGDDRRADLEGASSAGMRALLLHRDGGEAQGGTVADLRAILDHVAA